MKLINDFTDRLFGPAADTKIANCLVQMAEIGRDAALTLKNSKCKDIRAIEKFERASDGVEKQLHILLDSAFQLRFFDKRDVEHVSSELDNTVDRMRSIAKHVEDYHVFFRAAEFPKEGERMLDIIVEMTETVHTLMTRIESRHMPVDEISAMVDILDRDESEADGLFRTARALLIKQHAPHGNAMEFNAWDELFRKLEQVTDDANHVGNYVLSIARK